MKEKSNATLRRAASLRCRTDAAIARLGRAVACYQRGAITTVELLREASAAADRAGNLELSEAGVHRRPGILHGRRRPHRLLRRRVRLSVCSWNAHCHSTAAPFGRNLLPALPCF